MAGDTIECYNCGNPNPSWAQVCRSCGTPIRPGRTRRPSGPVPTDPDSIVAIGAGVGAIVLAIILGVFVSGLIPAAPVATPTPSPSPTPSATPLESATPLASVEESLEPTPEPTPELIGTVSFGTGLNSSKKVTGETDTFGKGTAFCHSVSLSEAFGVSKMQEEVLKVADDGSLTVVQARETTNLNVSSGSKIAGFCAPSSDALISAWGAGDYILRDYRGGDTPELIAEGHFTLTR